MDIWSLQRPSSFLDAIEDAVREGSNVVARFPGFVPKGLDQELRERVQSILEWTPIIAPRSETDPAGFLRERICPDISALRARNMADLAYTEEFQGRLIWIESIDRSEWTRWASALAAYSNACRNVDLVYRTVFIVVLAGDTVSGGCPEEVALVCQDFRNVLNDLEMFIYALWKTSDTVRPEHRALLAHTVSQIAQWDCSLADELLSLPIAEVLAPTDALARYARCRGWTSDTPRNWESGTLDGPADRPIVHSAILSVAGDYGPLRRRIWAAQAAVLLPYVEARRVELIPRCRRYLRLPIEADGGKLITDPFDLEVGQLTWCLDRNPTPFAIRKQLRFLRDVRNKLSHLEPIEPEYALSSILFPDM